MTKHKVHGTINAFLSIVSYSIGSRRILIDYSTQSTAFVCHLKARTIQDFDAWIEVLKQHRLYYQYKCLEQSSFGMNRNAPHANNSQSGQNQQINSSASVSNSTTAKGSNVNPSTTGTSSLSNSVSNRESVNFSNSMAAAKSDSTNSSQGIRYVVISTKIR
jgi:hypothetical protein